MYIVLVFWLDHKCSTWCSIFIDIFHVLHTYVFASPTHNIYPYVVFWEEKNRLLLNFLCVLVNLKKNLIKFFFFWSYGWIISTFNLRTILYISKPHIFHVHPCRLLIRFQSSELQLFEKKKKWLSFTEYYCVDRYKPVANKFWKRENTKFHPNIPSTLFLKVFVVCDIDSFITLLYFYTQQFQYLLFRPCNPHIILWL